MLAAACAAASAEPFELQIALVASVVRPILVGEGLQSTPDNSNLQGKLKKVRFIGSSSYRE